MFYKMRVEKVIVFNKIYDFKYMCIFWLIEKF